MPALQEIDQAELENKEKDIVAEVRKIIDTLEQLDKSYFAKDRQKLLKQKIDEAISMLDTKPLDLGKYLKFKFLT